MKHSVRFKGHESFVIREGWLNKGLREVKQNPKVFFENYGADALGVGPNMAKAVRYWLKCSGLTDESVRTVVRITGLGEMILRNDPYFEETFSLWIIHCNIARNRRQATAWQLFFNEFDYEEFTREELERKMLKLADTAAKGQKISPRSVKDDCEALLRMYTDRKKKDSSPEEKNISPFGVLGLLRETEEGFAKEQPKLHRLPAEIVLYLLSEMAGEKRGISMEELLTAQGSPGRILNLRRTGLMELLEQLEEKERLIINQTAGLDMIYLAGQMAPEQILQDYYESIRIL
ncbi:MAG: DUF4007 family protein [Lachnospiraceae bacterium]|nr:DUF4007 family protein [Lachnospiraceae bacterium]